ncbi:MAG: hypothetical protein WBC91_15185 [Phototrophicaceae bacterium]
MQRLIHTELGLDPGHITIDDIAVMKWGSEVIVDCTYEYPPTKKQFRLIFSDCLSMEWFIQQNGSHTHHTEHPSLLTHDLGGDDYQRTARIASTAVEVIISYGKLKIERDW